MKNITRTLGALALFAIVTPTHGIDGRIEINQAKMLAGGVTPGDFPGLPVSIGQPGSYVLTSNLDLSVDPNSPNLAAIHINADGVSLDLNGFEIRGTTTCTGVGATLVCTPTGMGYGIFVQGNGARVHGGSIRGIGGVGIYESNLGLGEYWELAVSQCGAGGIDVNGTVRAAHVDHNQGVGILTDWAGSVLDSYSSGNLLRGISTSAAVVRGNIASENGGIGIESFSSSVIDCISAFNGGVELWLSGCSWGGNTLSGCGGPCVTSAGSVQVGANNCAGVACP
ncbi:MAG: right-handed parallel beta-helix repeat-containing protein [Thermoanaerobaculia bacterium]